MSRAVALVSDSTSVHAELAQRFDVIIVPLQVVIGAKAYDEGSGASPETVAAALKARTSVSTSRPSPEAFLRVYERASKDGADAVVSVHLSSEVSGTFDSAELAARRASIPVYVVDSRQLGMATGFAVQSAAQALDRGADAEEAAAVASSRAAAMTALFYVDTLEHLRRGGRVGTTAALLGSALAVKPLLKVEDGCIVALEKVRTSAKALNRMQELAVAAAGDEDVDVAVSHLANAAGAEALASQLKERLPQLDHVVVTQVGAVIGAHVGPGMLAVVVAPRQPQRLDEATDSAQEDDSG